MGIGTWAWGDRYFWNYGRDYDEDDVRSAFETSITGGVNFIDSAEAYGRGRSERIISDLINSTDQPVIVATKFFPFPWRLSRSSLVRALKGSLRRLGLDQVHLYQLHMPFPPISIETWSNALADVVEMGLTQAVGVSNFSVDQLRRAHRVLIKRGIFLASNQIPYSLLNRDIETNNMFDVCEELGITVIAYSPLAQGLLTGKYSPENMPSGARGRRYSREFLTSIQRLIRIMRNIGFKHDSKTPAQVALNWTICKGTVPIPGSKNAQQAQDNIGALGWRLTDDEVATLDEVSNSVISE